MKQTLLAAGIGAVVLLAAARLTAALPAGCGPRCSCNPCDEACDDGVEFTIGPTVCEPSCDEPGESQPRRAGQGDTIWFDPLPPECCPSQTCEPSDCLPPGRRPRRARPKRWAGEPAAPSPGEACGGEDFCDQADLGPQSGWEKSLTGWWLRDLEVFAGIHGFKGPFDQGRNGNFGFHEGFNYGAPLGFWDWGWQVGLAGVHSNLAGSQSFGDRSADRNQFFLTGGLFRRARDWGCQWGLTYDWLHDAYYAQADLKQIRSDTSLLLPGGKRELGYFGAYGTGGTSFVLINRELKYLIFMQPTDIFAFYYRRYFEGGGDGRIWAGWSGNGDGLLGGEIRVPMGHSWALENRVNYLIPKHGHNGALQESWGVSIQLVWYPGHPARCVRYHPYRPMLAVADNTLFMTDTFVPPTAF